MILKDYLVTYERGEDGGWGAYAPDLPGLGVAAETFEEVDKLIREGIVIHIDGLKEDGLPIPEPTTIAGRVPVFDPFTSANDPLLALVGIGAGLWSDDEDSERINTPE